MIVMVRNYRRTSLEGLQHFTRFIQSTWLELHSSIRYWVFDPVANIHSGLESSGVAISRAEATLVDRRTEVKWGAHLEDSVV